VDADPARIAQVLRNVLVNAAKFTPSGGLVTVRTEEADGFVRASVTDNGQGLSVDELEHLFEPFRLGRETRVGRAGLGLGLAICRGIVQAHGGRIRAHSLGQGRGTTIEIELERSDQPTTEMGPVVPTRPIAAMRPAVVHRPAWRRAQPLLTAPHAETEGPARGQRSDSTEWTPVQSNRILLVEDHEDSAETLAIILSMKGYQVSVARSLAEATQLAETPDILISDISLPDGSGLELPRLLKRDPPLKAIAMSGYGTEGDRRRSQEAGFAEHLTKPVNIDQLLAALRRLTPELPAP
jgi:CheY-like chemotaxis protein